MTTPTSSDEKPRVLVVGAVDSPIGTLRVVATLAGIREIHFADGEPVPPAAHPGSDDHAAATVHLERARCELGEYFAGTRRSFGLDIDVVGTAFQLEAWQALTAIGYGETSTYARQAERIGRPNAVRAIGAANGRNPVPIVVPCHRVIGADGSLTGFSGGLELKRWLLDHEAGRRSLDLV